MLFFFCLVFVMPLCASVYLCLVALERSVKYFIFHLSKCAEFVSTRATLAEFLFKSECHF